MNRRSFLNWGAAGMAALWSAVGVSLGSGGPVPHPERVLRAATELSRSATRRTFPFGPPTFLPEEKIFVFRDKEKGFAVASAVCTHLGCTVQYFSSDRRFHCPCHGSVFAADGAVQHGPAPSRSSGSKSRWPATDN